jgi:hypothetical protein
MGGKNRDPRDECAIRQWVLAIHIGNGMGISSETLVNTLDEKPYSGPLERDRADELDSPDRPPEPVAQGSNPAGGAMPGALVGPNRIADRARANPRQSHSANGNRFPVGGRALDS